MLLFQYYALGLSSNQHNLTVYADPSTNTGPFIDVDAVFVYSTGGSSNQTSPSSSGEPSGVQRQVNSFPSNHVILISNPKQRRETFQNDRKDHDRNYSRFCSWFLAVASTSFLLPTLAASATKKQG